MGQDPSQRPGRARSAIIRAPLMPAKVKGRFIEPMLLLRTDALPGDSERWEYQLKFDGYRAIAFKTAGKLHLRSRNDNDFSVRYADVLKGLAKLPDDTVIDGEVIALDEDGRPSFGLLRQSSIAHLVLRSRTAVRMTSSSARAVTIRPVRESPAKKAGTSIEWQRRMMLDWS